jgi:hypothetical protein
VRLSTWTNYGEPFTRNNGIRDLVWKSNPYLDGFTDELPNVGETGWPPTEYFRASKRATSPIDTVATVHGLPLFKRDGSTRILEPKPDIFYKPKQRSDFAGKIVCDPRSTSQPFSPESIELFVEFMARWYGAKRDEIIVLDSISSGNHGVGALPANPRYSVADIFEYADILHSAAKFLVTEAGGQSLAAALRTASTHVLITTRSYNERVFLWPSNIYHVTSSMTSGSDEWP